MTVSDVVIVGGGVNGCATAYHLAREGHAVTVVERYAPAAMASGWTLAGVRQSARDPAELPLARAAVDTGRPSPRSSTPRRATAGRAICA